MTSIELELTLPVSPDDLFAAWLDGDRHGAMIGADATGSPHEGASFSAWGGYITGTNLSVAPHRVVQAWRTLEFPPDAPASTLELSFEPTPGGTRLRLRHTDLPPDQVDRYRLGWQEHYFAPMRLHFGG